MSPAPHPLEPDEHRRARHLFMLKSLADRGHALAMKAADKAETQLDSPDPRPRPRRAHPPITTTPTSATPASSASSSPAEHRLLTNTQPTRRPYRASGPEADPRSPSSADSSITPPATAPTAPQLRRAALDTLAESLDHDPACTRAPADILFELCQQYGLPFDIAQLPDEFLEVVVNPPNAPDDG